MGKIILTERQYRNLNQILIGKEVENNKGRLNEITEDEKLTADSVGTKIQGIYKFCNVSIPTLAHLKCISDMTNQLNRLKTKEQFDIAGKITSYWYTGNWAKSLGEFLKKLMSNGTVRMASGLGGSKNEMVIKIVQLY